MNFIGGTHISFLNHANASADICKISSPKDSNRQKGPTVLKMRSGPKYYLGQMVAWVRHSSVQTGAPAG